MKLLWTFDTERKEKEFNKVIQKYWKENVMLITRDRIFFLFFILIPLLLLTALWLSFIAIWFIVNSWMLNWILGILFIIISLPGWYKILKKYFDYTLDFAIIAPDWIQSFNQTGFFKLTSNQLDSYQIEQVKTVQSWILNSVFNYGTVSILTDSNAAWVEADIRLKYMTNPRELESRIRETIKTEGEMSWEDRMRSNKKKTVIKKQSQKSNINWSRKSDKEINKTIKNLL